MPERISSEYLWSDERPFSSVKRSIFQIKRVIIQLGLGLGKSGYSFIVCRRRDVVINREIKFIIS